MEQDLTLILSRLGFSAIGFGLLVFSALLLSAYVKIATVLALLRAGFGIFSVTSAMVIGGLALALSFFIMYPTVEASLKAMDGALKSKPAANDQERAVALDAGMAQWKTFIVRQTTPEERKQFADLAVKLRTSSASQPPVSAEALAETWQVLTPVFFLSQLRSAFTIGLLLLLPFLVIDLLVSTILSTVGLENLNAHLISLPVKLLVFVLADGWGAIAGNLIRSYGAG